MSQDAIKRPQLASDGPSLQAAGSEGAEDPPRELEAARAEVAELSRRLALRTEELEATVAHLTSIENATHALEQAITELREEAKELRTERAQLSAQVETLSIHNDGLTRALGTLAQLKGKVAALEPALEASEARLELLERERQRTIESLHRLARSRAWRWGHGVTRVMRRLAMRPIRTGGAVEQLLQRLESLSPAPSPASEQESAAQLATGQDTPAELMPGEAEVIDGEPVPEAEVIDAELVPEAESAREEQPNTQ